MVVGGGGGVPVRHYIDTLYWRGLETYISTIENHICCPVGGEAGPHTSQNTIYPAVMLEKVVITTEVICLYGTNE